VSPAKQTNQPETVNLKQLAEHVRLTPGTVSAVLNNASYSKAIPQCTRDRIFAAAEELNYKPNFFARSLRVKKASRLIAVLTGDLTDGSSAIVIAGIEEHLRGQNYFMVSGSHRQESQLLKQYSVALMQRGVEGFITINLDRSHGMPLPQVSVDFPNGASSSAEAVITVCPQGDQLGASGKVVRLRVQDTGKVAAATLLERIAAGHSGHSYVAQRVLETEPAGPGFTTYRDHSTGGGMSEPAMVDRALTAKPLEVG
jgi:Bacterial regulatory proteins, lacI family